jgi:hypothetical protein
MIPVIVSFLFIIFSGMMVLLVLNYAVYLWENKKISDLSSQRKPDLDDPDDVLNKKTGAQGFTSRDMGGSLGKNSKSGLQQINSEQRKVVFVDDGEYPSWILSVRDFLTSMRTNFWVQIKNIWFYLINLTKSHSESNSNLKNSKKEKEETQIAEVVEKIQDADPEIQKQDTAQVVNQVIVINPKKPGSQATTLTKDQELFAKIENRLLQKLKDVGMRHYDIWVELGKLYEKYDQKEKAKEVYSFLLKNAQDKEKEFARNRLIEIS